MLARLPWLTVCGVLQRAKDFARTKPARKVLFLVLPRQAQYKAQSVIDTLVYRSGNALSNTLATPLAAAWLTRAVWLGRRQRDTRVR